MFFTENNDIEKFDIDFFPYFRNVFLPQKMFVLQIKYKSFLNIYSFCKKNFLRIKNIFVKTRCELNNLVLKVSEAANL